MSVDYVVTPMGLPLAFEADPSAQTVAVAIYFRAGSAYQGKVSGAAHFLEHCLFKGSRNFDKQALRQLLDQIGAFSNGITNRELVNYFFHCLPDKLASGAQWIQELVCRPLLEESAIIQERGVITNELARRENEQGFAHWKLVQKTMFGEHMWAETPLGNRESIQTMSPEYVRHLYQRLYVKQNAQVAIVGPVTASDAIGLTDQMFGELPDGEEQQIIRPPVIWEPCSLQEVSTNLKQDFYAISFPCFGWEDDRYPIANVIGSWLIGTGMPLYQKLRDDLSWIYSLGGGTRLSYHAGSVEVNGQVDSSHREQTLSIIREHMDRLCNDLMGTRDHDVLRSRRRMRFALDEQDLMERLSSVGHHALFTRVAVNRRAELESYLSVTREEIREIAQIVFNGPEKIAVVTNQ